MKPYLLPDTEVGRIVTVQIDWWPSFAIFPHRTITGQWIWLSKCYKRIVWRYTGFVDEPFTEYGTMFEILAEKH